MKQLYQQSVRDHPYKADPSELSICGSHDKQSYSSLHWQDQAKMEVSLPVCGYCRGSSERKLQGKAPSRDAPRATQHLTSQNNASSSLSPCRVILNRLHASTRLHRSQPQKGGGYPVADFLLPFKICECLLPDCLHRKSREQPHADRSTSRQ